MRLHAQELPGGVRLTETGHGWWATRDGGGELFTGDRASFWEEQGLEVMVGMVAQRSVLTATEKHT